MLYRVLGLWCGIGAAQVAWANACLNTPLDPIDCDGTSSTLDIYSYDPRILSNYAACVTLSEAGPERIIPFYCEQSGAVSAVLRNTDCDLDLFVIGDACNPGIDCPDGDIAATWGNGIHGTVAFNCTAGETYSFVVEGWALGYAPTTCPLAGTSSRMSDFTLQVRCDERCGDGFDNDLDGLADCADADCTCVEDCANPGDEDGNGLADCADVACAGEAVCCDDDGDGALAQTAACGGDDCNDLNAQIRPGRTELVANHVDEDCDGVDTCWRDADLDGFGGGTSVDGDDLDCDDGGPFSSTSGDCRDTGPGAALAWPGAPEVVGDGYDQDCDGVDDCFRDRDLDGFGAGDAQPGPAAGCSAAGWAAVADDCLDQGVGAADSYPGADEVCDAADNDCDGYVDDADPDLLDTMLAFPDADGDGYGANGGGLQVVGCVFPPGYVPFDGDCDDGNGALAPGRDDLPYDGVDQDCSGADLVDVDGDGHAGPAGTGPDCDDTAPLVNPVRGERGNGYDDDCDGVVDEATSWFDDDGDGFAEAGGDCDDTDALTRPGGDETCDGVDNDCDTLFDEGTICVDDDGDGYTEDAGDCHDGEAMIHPGRTEVVDNGLDDDCDGVTDQAVVVDLDLDGFADFAGDCDDADPAFNPSAVELPNGLDDDCNGRIDDHTALSDDDGDGWSEALGDCDDGDDVIYPGAVETADGRDQDCNGVVDDVGPWLDKDRDGWSTEQGDCDDQDADISPAAVERGNGADDDCDVLVDEGLDDRDGDGFSADDCDDSDGWANPGAAEVCDQRDNNCDGRADEGCAEPDGPGGGRGCQTAQGATGLLVLLWVPLLRRRRVQVRFRR